MNYKVQSYIKQFIGSKPAWDQSVLLTADLFTHLRAYPGPFVILFIPGYD